MVWGIRSRGGQRNRKKKKTSNINFFSYFDSRQKFVKEGDLSPKKWGSPTSLNREILGKLSFWLKVLHLPTNLPPCARSMNDVVVFKFAGSCACAFVSQCLCRLFLLTITLLFFYKNFLVRALSPRKAKFKNLVRTYSRLKFSVNFIIFFICTYLMFNVLVHVVHYKHKESENNKYAQCIAITSS